MNLLSRWLASSLVLVGAVSLVECGQRGSENAQTVRVGAILDLTGPAASFGQMQSRGIEFAISRINAHPACRFTLESRFEDSRLDPKLAVAAANKLVEQDHIAGVVSVTGSSMALVVAPIFARFQVPIIDSLSSAPALTLEGGPYYSRLQPSDTFAGKYLVDWATELPGSKETAIIYADSDWGQGLRDAIVSAAVGRIGIRASEMAKRGDVDFRPLLLRLRRVHVATVFLVAHPEEAGLIIRQMSELNYRPRILGSDTLSTTEVQTIAGSALDGAMYCLSSPGSGSDYEDYVAGFKSKFGEDPTINSVKASDSVVVFYQALCQAGSDPAGIQRALRSGASFKTAGGVIRFDVHGDVETPAYDRFVFKGSKAEKLGRDR